MKVKVHWNLHKGGFSVTDRKTGKIIKAITDNITIANPIAKLAAGKLQDCHDKGKRHVCAWIIGDLVEYQPLNGEAITYNPFKSDNFISVQTGELMPFNQELGAFASFTINQNAKPSTIIGK
jgi:hypothetical protein